MNDVRKTHKVMRSTEKHILDHVEMFSADGAANEQLAGRLLPPPRRAIGADAEVDKTSR